MYRKKIKQVVICLLSLLLVGCSQADRTRVTASCLVKAPTDYKLPTYKRQWSTAPALRVSAVDKTLLQKAPAVVMTLSTRLHNNNMPLVLAGVKGGTACGKPTACFQSGNKNDHPTGSPLVISRANLAKISTNSVCAEHTPPLTSERQMLPTDPAEPFPDEEMPLGEAWPFVLFLVAYVLLFRGRGGAAKG